MMPMRASCEDGDVRVSVSFVRDWASAVVTVHVDLGPTHPGDIPEDLFDTARLRAIDILVPPRPRGRPPGKANRRHRARCEWCHTPFEAGRSGSRWCGSTCRSRGHRAALERPQMTAEVLAEIIAVENALRPKP